MFVNGFLYTIHFFLYNYLLLLFNVLKFINEGVFFMKYKNNLKKLREHSGYSQEEIANKLGIFRSTISRYENGERKINGENLVKLAKLFNVTPEYLLGLEDDKKKDNIINKEQLTKDNMAFFKAKDISDEDKKKMIEMMQEFYYKEKLKNEK